jgi:hypothetical protein
MFSFEVMDLHLWFHQNNKSEEQKKKLCQGSYGPVELLPIRATGCQEILGGGIIERQASRQVEQRWITDEGTAESHEGQECISLWTLQETRNLVREELAVPSRNVRETCRAGACAACRT